MAKQKKLLVVDDEIANTTLLKRVLNKAGYSALVAHNGKDALSMLEREQFDALLTDWMMPQMDGIELIRKVRDRIEPLPLIIMITALVSHESRNYALESGADDFIAKPIDMDELLSRVRDGLARRAQEEPEEPNRVIKRDMDISPAFVGVVIGASTGGPPTLIEVLKNLPGNLNAAYYIVQHAPPWMLETFSQRLQKETGMKVNIAVNGDVSEAGSIYLAPGDKHMRIEKGSYKILLDDGPKENFVRPAADPLFRSAADAFGKYSLGIVLTGLGRDGAQGASQIASVNGTVLVQAPETAVAPAMPNTVIQSGIDHKVVPLNMMSKTSSETIFPLAEELGKD